MESIIAVLLMATVCFAYKTGPPVGNDGFCANMMPSHDSQTAQDPNTFDGLYSIKTDSECFKENSLVTLTINATAVDQFFEGFFVQARKVAKTDNSYGMFDKADNYPVEFEDNVQALNCFGGNKNSIGHKGAKHQVLAPLTWTAPAGLKENIEFVSVVVFHKPTFWVNVKRSLMYEANCVGPTAPPAGSAGRISGVAGLVAAAILTIKSLL